MGELNSFLKIVLCIAGLYILPVNGYVGFIEKNSYRMNNGDNTLLEESKEEIDFQPIDTWNTIHKPKLTFFVISNASNLRIIKEHLEAFKSIQNTKINLYSANNLLVVKKHFKMFEKFQITRINRHVLRSRSENRKNKKRVNGCVEHPQGIIPCPIKSVKKYPKVIISHDKHISKPYEFKEMKISVDICSDPDEKCNIERTHLKFANAESLCNQIYSTHNILTTNNGETTTSTFQIESGCRCAVYVDGEEKYSYCPKNKYHV